MDSSTTGSATMLLDVQFVGARPRRSSVTIGSADVLRAAATSGGDELRIVVLLPDHWKSANPEPAMTELPDGFQVRCDLSAEQTGLPTAIELATMDGEGGATTPPPNEPLDAGSHPASAATS